jgi:hypothetical protein
MSALPSKADMFGATRDVRFGPIADMEAATSYVAAGAETEAILTQSPRYCLYCLKRFSLIRLRGNRGNSPLVAAREGRIANDQIKVDFYAQTFSLSFLASRSLQGCGCLRCGCSRDVLPYVRRSSANPQQRDFRAGSSGLVWRLVLEKNNAVSMGGRL